MAHINECVPGTQVRVLESGVARVRGKVGVIVEVSRVKRRPADPVRDSVTVDVPGHGEIVLKPEEVRVET
jgi:hypothetical protein